MVIRNQSQQGQFGAQRGAAGETRMSGPRLQFSNLYQMNRANNTGEKEFNDFNRQANLANQNMASEVNKAKGLGQAADLANKTENWSVGAEAMKKGLSAQQAAITDLYAGGASNPYTSKIRSFGNIFANAKGMFPGTQGTPGQAIPKPGQAPPEKWTSPERAQELSADNPSGTTRVLDTLEWALQTGRITTDEYYAAQGGPGTPGYDKIRGKLN